MTLYDPSGRVALITGAAQGIGLETARLLHQRGASVSIVDVDAAEATRAAARLGSRALALGADVRDREALRAAVAGTVERLGGIDVLVANAGVASPAATAEGCAPESFERVVDVNLVGVWNTIRAALPHVVERRGHVVLVASIYAFFNGVMNAPYAASKAGVEALGRAMRVELAPTGATVGVAYFGFVETAMVRQAFTDPLARRLEGRYPALTRRIPVETAGAALVRGIERRAPRVIAPFRWRVAAALRGVVNPLADTVLARDARVRAVVAEARDREARARRKAGAP